MKPRLAITMGDINGVGPEILARALARGETWETCLPVVIGSVEVMERARLVAPECPPVRRLDEPDGVRDREAIPVVEAGVEAPAQRLGQVDGEAGRCAVEWLRHAIRLALDGAVDGIVTCPLNKKGIQLAGYEYAGHTEILAEMTSSDEVRMCLFTDRMRIVHVSAHCPISEVVGYVKTDRIARSIHIGDDALERLGLPRRRIAVAGLNPHAGEDGILGSEEADEIAPAVLRCRDEGVDCSGPYPPDTVFLRMLKGEFDLVVAMYHDQGHIPLKLVAMDEGVNVTLGLPIVRTSVDHGTAYDIAGRGQAREGSLCAAIRLAAQLAGSRNDATHRGRE